MTDFLNQYRDAPSDWCKSCHTDRNHYSIWEQRDWPILAFLAIFGLAMVGFAVFLFTLGFFAANGWPGFLLGPFSLTLGLLLWHLILKDVMHDAKRVLPR